MKVEAITGLPEEVVAVLFAYFSRSSKSMRDNLADMLEGDVPESVFAPQVLTEKARKFHEKWVVGYGHGSVAEHAVVHLSIEDISILAAKELEDCRLASYTEKSTRYVEFDQDSFHIPFFPNDELKEQYVEQCRDSINTYKRLLPKLRASIKEKHPQPEGWNKAKYDNAVKCKAFDMLRGLLPVSTLTSLGVTINARSLEHTLAKLYSYFCQYKGWGDGFEFHNLAKAIHEASATVVPTLIKYAGQNDSLGSRQEDVINALECVGVNHLLQNSFQMSEVSLLSTPEPGGDLLVDAIAYERLHQPLNNSDELSVLTINDMRVIIEAYTRNRSEHDGVGRAFELIGPFVFEVTCDYGAYRDIQRHRMSTQFKQLLIPHNGFECLIDKDDEEIRSEYMRICEQAEKVYDEISGVLCSVTSQYVLPLATRINTHVSMNLRELIHFIELRSKKEGHISYRRIAQDMHKHLLKWLKASPELEVIKNYIRVDTNDYDFAR